MITMGMDIGSTTSKCVILQDGVTVLGQSLVVAGIGTAGPQQAFEQALSNSGCAAEAISYRMATGYGRMRWPEADGEMSELSAHGMGCHFLQPETRTIIDIGGQDAKAIRLDDKGRMSNFVMNDKCAAGTGRFLDVMAGILSLGIDQLGTIAGQATCSVNISSTCTVFAESEVISQLANGAEIPDVVEGICQSVAVRVAALAKRVGVKETVFMSGGVSRNSGVRHALSQALGVPVSTTEDAQLAGALGAALQAYRITKQG